jgi:peptide/nickel transport system ATP-binding protein
MTNLADVTGLNIRFTGDRTVHAVNDLSFSSGELENPLQIPVVTPANYG